MMLSFHCLSLAWINTGLIVHVILYPFKLYVQVQCLHVYENQLYSSLYMYKHIIQYSNIVKMSQNTSCEGLEKRETFPFNGLFYKDERNFEWTVKSQMNKYWSMKILINSILKELWRKSCKWQVILQSWLKSFYSGQD